MQEPKSLDQYKRYTKKLKLDIKNNKTSIDDQKQQILTLQTELVRLRGLQLQANSTDKQPQAKMPATSGKTSEKTSDLQTLQGKHELMQKFKSGTTGFGITPESIFRVADYVYKNQVEADYFRQVLSKIDMGLTPHQISGLIYILDENCTGFITKQDYYDSLNAYMISLEEPYLPYMSFCLEKLAKLLQGEKCQLVKFYAEMEVKSGAAIDRNRFYDKIKTLFAGRIKLREIVGAFNAIDLQHEGVLTRKNFLYAVTSAMNKSSNPNNISRMTNNNNNQQNPNQNSRYQSNTISRVKSPAEQQNTPQIKTNFQSQAAPTESSELISAIQTQCKIRLQQIYQEICRNPLEQRLTLFQFKKILSKLSTKIPAKLAGSLFRQIDMQQRGTVHFPQLMRFYLQHESDISPIFHLMGVYFHTADLNPDKFWFMNGIATDGDISRGRFLEVLARTFGEGPWDKVWAYFDKGSRGVVSVGAVSRELARYESARTS